MKMHFANPPQVRKAIRSARHEVFLAIPEDCTWSEPEVDISAAHDITGKDLLVRIFIPSTLTGSGRIPESDLTRLAKSGVEIRRIPENVPRMALIDRKTFIIARNHMDYAEGALIGLGLPFVPMIVRSLAGSRPPERAERDSPAPLPLDPLGREVLRQLVRGTKDEAAAREMGMALRTYRRVVARLMGQLDARSRFQAGYAAARRHLL